MMKLTNKYNLPETLVRACRSFKHKQGDYSVTQLLGSIQAVLLIRRHYAEIEEDVSDRVWALLGQGVHAILDKADHDNSLKEEYMSTEILGRIVTGSCDLYDGFLKKITDWKVTGVYGIIYADEPLKPEWEQQINMYAYLFRLLGFEVSVGEVVAVLRDWAQSKASAGGNYPQVPILSIPVPIWPEEQQKLFLTRKVANVIEHEKTPDAGLPECTVAERWGKLPKYAVMKKGGKRAVRVLDSMGDAKQYIKENPPKPGTEYHTEERDGDLFFKCHKYCNAKAFCHQYQRGLSCK
jgi:hypothetical protein